MNNLFRYLTIVYLFIFSLSCDSRSPVDGEDASGADLSADDLMIDNNGTFTIDVVDLNQDESVDFAVTPIDEYGGQINNGLSIRFEILDDSPGYLSSSSVAADSSGAQQTFYISPSSNLVDGAFNFNLVTKIRTFVEDEPSVNDTINILYEDGNLQTEDETLNILTALPDTISIGEESIVTAYLTGTLNGQSGVGIPDQYVRFQSLIPEDGPDGSQDFGEMNPEYVKTDSIGMVQSIFTPLSETGFGKIRATYDDLLDETFIEVLSGEAINVEIEIPTENNLQVTGGGGIESVTINAVIKDGGGNVVNDSYAVIFLFHAHTQLMVHAQLEMVILVMILC